MIFDSCVLCWSSGPRIDSKTHGPSKFAEEEREVADGHFAPIGDLKKLMRPHLSFVAFPIGMPNEGKRNPPKLPTLVLATS
jgi:hypothetical protein